MPRSQYFQGLRGFVENVYNKDIFIKTTILGIKYPQKIKLKKPLKFVDNVHNYYFKSSSPIFTTSPAPIVINTSLGAQFSLIKFSISLKEGK